MSEFKKIDDVLKYVREGISNGTLVPFEAEKFARIIARPGVVGETVVSWSVNDKGEPIEEKVAAVELDEETKRPGWVVTKANEDGSPVVDANGHTNDWIITDSKFVKKYELQEGAVYRPTGGKQIFVRIPEDLSLAQWGGYENIAAGGYINITNSGDMYGISQRDFEDTYRVVESQEKKPTV